MGFDYELLTCVNPWRFVRCQGCGHAWLNPRPPATALPVIYPPSYYAYDYAGKVSPLALRGKGLLDALKFRGILSQLRGRPRMFLDVGCGDGRYLRLMEKQGVPRANACGLELDTRVVARLVAEGYPVYAERVEDCRRFSEASFDLVTMFHVIEHVADPARVVRRLTSWLRPGGILAVETPNLDSLDARLFSESYWGGYHIPRHWHVFTSHSLERLLRAAGLEVAGLRYQTGHSFWMYSLHHHLRYGARPRPRLARHFDPFQGLPLLMLFTAWDTLRAACGLRTSAMLMLARRPEVG